MFNNIETPIFVLLDIYSRLIKPVTKVCEISFYRLNKNNINYIFKTKCDPENQYFGKYIVRGNIVFITKIGVNKLITDNRKRI